MFNKRQLILKVEAHKYSFENQKDDIEKEIAEENMKRIERELETENFHCLLQLLIDNDYCKAFEWIEKEYK